MTISSEPIASLPPHSFVRAWLPAIGISLLISLMITSPFFWRGTATGHDFQFHVESWLDAAGQWKQGILYPRWTQWADYGYGEPRFIFYPPLSWMLGAALGLMMPWNAVPVVSIVLVQTFAGVSAFALARRLLSERAAMFCAAACYAANPYALLIVYMRSDFAELLADAFFPLLLLFAFQLCGMLQAPSGARDRLPARALAAFAAVFAAIWLSNAPAGVIGTYGLAFVFIFMALTRRSPEPLWRGGCGLLLGFGLTAFYLLPAAYEQRWVNIAQALSSGLLPSQNFLYTEINDPEHTIFNWTVSTLAVFMIALAGFAAIAGRRTGEIRDFRAETEKSTQAVAVPWNSALTPAQWRVLLLLTSLSAFLMLRLSSIVWLLLPKLRFVQFPWRWMSLLALPFALFLASLMARKRGAWAWTLVTFGLLIASGVVLVQRGWWSREDIDDVREAIANQQGFDGTDEYDPLGDDHTNIPIKSPEVQVMDTDTLQGPVVKPTVRVERWSPEEKVVTASSRLPFYLGLRLLNYPAWRVELNGARVMPRGGEDYNQMIVQVPAGESRIQVKFARTWDRTLGGAISFASGLLVIWLAWRRKE